MIRNVTLLLVLSAAACGGKKSAPATTTTTQNAEAGQVPAEHHEGMPAEMTKFHDVLAPRWHAEKGAKRMKDTCDAVPQFRTVGDEIAKATPPTKANADTWTTSTKALMESISGLETTCKANDATKFEEAFHKLHESFHGLMAAAGVEHTPGEHEHEGHQEHKM